MRAEVQRGSIALLREVDSPLLCPERGSMAGPAPRRVVGRASHGRRGHVHQSALGRSVFLLLAAVLAASFSRGEHPPRPDGARAWAGQGPAGCSLAGAGRGEFVELARLRGGGEGGGSRRADSSTMSRRRLVKGR